MVQYFGFTRKGRLLPALNSEFLLPGALISLVTAGQREEIELEIVETPFYLLAFVFFSSAPTPNPLKLMGRAAIVRTTDFDFSNNTVLQCKRLYSLLWF